MWPVRKLTYVKEWRHQQGAHFHTHSFTRYSQIFHTIPAGDSWQTHDNFLSVLQIVVFTATVSGYGYSLVLFHTQIVWQRLHDSHKCSKLFVLHVRLECFLSKCRFAKCRVCTWYAFIVMHKKFTNDTICGQYEDIQKTIATNHTELLSQGWKQDPKWVFYVHSTGRVGLPCSNVAHLPECLQLNVKSSCSKDSRKELHDCKRRTKSQ